MIKNFLHDIALAIRARSGFTPALLVWFGIIVFALVVAFTFLSVAAYQWLLPQFGAVFAALIMAGVFLVIALAGVIATAVTRRRVKERAMLERAARAHSGSSWLLDPKILAAAMQAGRTLGWERIVPIALLGFIAAQWLRGRSGHDDDDSPQP
jgi:hypothetical protein